MSDVEDATAVPRSPVAATIEARGHTMIQDKPPASGGEDQGPMASEYLLASLLSCQLSTFHKVAAKRRSNVRVVRLRGELHFDGDAIDHVELEFHLRGDEAADRLDALVRLTDRACTISKALAVEVRSRYSVEAAAAPDASANSK